MIATRYLIEQLYEGAWLPLVCDGEPLAYHSEHLARWVAEREPRMCRVVPKQVEVNREKGARYERAQVDRA